MAAKMADCFRATVLITRAEGTKLRFRLCSFCCFNFSGIGLYVLGICEINCTNKDGEFAALNS